MTRKWLSGSTDIFMKYFPLCGFSVWHEISCFRHLVFKMRVKKVVVSSTWRVLDVHLRFSALSNSHEMNEKNWWFMCFFRPSIQALLLLGFWVLSFDPDWHQDSQSLIAREQKGIHKLKQNEVGFFQEVFKRCTQVAMDTDGWGFLPTLPPMP